MARRRKKPIQGKIDYSPIKNLDPIWLDQPVRSPHWEYHTNRKHYLLWLGQRLGFRQMADWYHLNTDHIKQNRGGGLAQLHWNKGSAVAAVMDVFPEYDWKEWLFDVCPRRFWKEPANHRPYLDWLGEQLGIEEWEAWYQVSNQDFARHNGGAFLLEYDSTVSAAIMQNFPEHEWLEWMFRLTPKHFWELKKNRRRYMNWLGEQLGYRTSDDWYAISREDFLAHHGRYYLAVYQHNCVVSAVMEHFPRKHWLEWKFRRVPAGFWDQAENRRRYLEWFAKELRIRTKEDWFRIRRGHFNENYGGALILRYGSYLDLLREHLPEIDWSQHRGAR